MTDIDYLRLAYKLALESPDPSTQNGAIIVVNKGGWETFAGKACNRFPQLVNPKEERLERPLKYAFVEHAERGAIYAACKKGISTDGGTMYVCWAACADCARAIINAGIRRVVTDRRTFDNSPSHWQETIKYAYQMFEEAEVKVEFINEHLGCEPILRNGQLWQP